MPLTSEAWGWFERAVFDLSIAQANLQSRIWLDAARYARQAAVKFLQAALVQTGEPEPAPRILQLAGELQKRVSSFSPDESWAMLDGFAGAESATEEEARAAYGAAEAVRDAVSRVLEH